MINQLCDRKMVIVAKWIVFMFLEIISNSIFHFNESETNKTLLVSKVKYLKPLLCD